MNHRIKLILLAAIIVSAIKADEVANVKTNLLYDLTSTINLGAEVGLNRHLSLDLSGNYNPWTLTDGMKIRHWLLQPELRWWPRERMSGHFVGFHIVGGEYNLDKAQLLYNVYPTLRDYRFEGWGIGAGIAWGYRWNFSRRLTMEGEIGVGAIRSKWDRYACGDCGERLGSGTQTYVGPTKLALNLIYRFGPADKKKKPALVEKIIEKVRVDTVYITRVERDTMVRNITDTVRLKSEIIHADYALRLTYPLNSSRIEPMLADNAARIDSLVKFVERYAADPSLRIRSIDIVGYSSLEGNAARNLTLSQERADAAAELLESLRPDLAPLIHAEGLGEDWDSVDFRGKSTLMADSDLDSRERRLRAIDGGALMRRLLVTTLPATRRIECVINFSYIER